MGCVAATVESSLRTTDLYRLVFLKELSHQYKQY